MTQKRYIVKLTEEERVRLGGLIFKGKGSANKLLRARILLKADEAQEGGGWSDGRIIEALDTNASMVYRVRREVVEEGVEAALSRKQRETPPVSPIFDGEKEARLIQLACSSPPEGHARWTLQLLADQLVALKIVERVSDDTVQRALKKTRSSRILRNSG